MIILISFNKSDEVNRFGDHYVFEPSDNNQTSKSEIPIENWTDTRIFLGLTLLEL